MFGSNFNANFGLPAFPFENMDPQGGYLGPNASQGEAPMPGGPPSAQVSPPQPGSPAPAAPQGNPLAPGPLAPGAQPQAAPEAPAAGIGSPFGKPQP